MAEKVNTAVIGLGMFGALQAQIYAESPLAELKAVVSQTAERAQEIGERFGANWYTDFREMLEKVRDAQWIQRNQCFSDSLVWLRFIKIIVG